MTWFMDGVSTLLFESVLRQANLFIFYYESVRSIIITDLFQGLDGCFILSYQYKRQSILQYRWDAFCLLEIAFRYRNLKAYCCMYIRIHTRLICHVQLAFVLLYNVLLTKTHKIIYMTIQSSFVCPTQLFLFKNNQRTVYDNVHVYKCWKFAI